MSNKWATPSLILGIAAAVTFPVNTFLPASLGAVAAIVGSFGVRGDTKRIQALIGMVLGFLAFAFSGYTINF